METITVREWKMAATATVASMSSDRGIWPHPTRSETVLSSDGVHLVDVYVGSGGVLTGAARLARNRRPAGGKRVRRGNRAKKAEFEARKLSVEAQVAGMLAELSAQEKELQKTVDEAEERKRRLDRSGPNSAPEACRLGYYQEDSHNGFIRRQSLNCIKRGRRSDPGRNPSTSMN